MRIARAQTIPAACPLLRAAAAAVFLSLATAAAARAQMPGIAVLQNAWTNPGITAALDVGFGGGGNAYGVAGAWAPSSGRFQLSAAAGVRSVSGAGSGATGGLRVAVPFWSTRSGAMGIAGFAGLGSSRAASDTNVAGGKAILSQLPVGVSLGYRRQLGATHGISVHASPFFALWRRSIPAVDSTATRAAVPAVTQTSSLFRLGVGVDAGITSRLGATAGVELGSSRSGGAGPSGTLTTVALSWAFGRR